MFVPLVIFSFPFVSIAYGAELNQ